MPHFTESLDALRREAPARFLETDQFAEMLSTYHKLKPLAQSKPKSFAQQCAACLFVTHDDKLPGLFVAGAGGEAGCLEDGLQVFVGDGTLCVEEAARVAVAAEGEEIVDAHSSVSIS